MRKEKKTNVMRILDKAKIPYTARSYEYKESNLSGTHAAAALGYDPAIVFKTKPAPSFFACHPQKNWI